MIRNVAQLGKRVWLAGIRGHLNTRCRPPDSERTRYRPHLEEFESRTTPASLITDFTQGANGDVVHSPPLGDITWLNGILNPNNSEYFEGVSTLQRLFFDNIATTSGDVHTLTFSHQAVKGSTHAYDFLTSWAQALAATNAIAPGTLVNPNTDSSDAGSIIEAVEPGSSSPANFTTVTTALRGGSFFFDVDIPDNLGSILGDNVQDRIAAYEGFFGNRTLRIWGNAAITSASLVFTGYTGSSGNEQANYTLTWTSASSRILVEFAGHLAMGRDFTISGVGYGVGKGAGSISGGPYHISLDKLDGASLGKQDNQIQANAVGLPPDYTIVKTGDELSKIGDLTSYTITITNTGGLALFPQSINDTLAGSLSAGSFSESGTDNDILDLGETWTRTYDAQIPQGASDPFVNTVTAIFDTQANLSGIEVTRNDEHSVNLFQPAIDVLKEVVSAPATIVAGSVVRFRITITDGDTSSDSPDLVPFSIVDDKFGTIAASQFTESGGVGGLNDNKLQENEVWKYEYDYTVLASDVPSFTNTVNVLFKPEGFPNELRDTSGVRLAVDVPDFTIVKTGDELSKIGDQTSYTITITNTGTADLFPQSISDTLAGALSAGSFTESGSGTKDNILQTKEVWTHTYSLPIPQDATDPFVNTVTAIFDTESNLLGFDSTRSDSHSVNLFQPAIDVVKSADRSTAAIGDTITYTYVVTRGLSSADTPALENVMLTDDPLGTITAVVKSDGDTDDLLEPGETWTYTASHVVVGSDPGTYSNTATVTANPSGFPNVLSDVSSWTVDLFQPGITVVKTGDALSKIGDDVTYTYVVTNTGSLDSPGLANVVLTDDKLGPITAVVKTNDDGDDLLELNETWTYTATATIPSGASDPYINLATVTAGAVGSVATVSDTDEHSVNLFQPAIDVLKGVVSAPATIVAGSVVRFRITITDGDTSWDSPDLVPFSIVDDKFGTIAASQFTESGGVGGLDDNKLQENEVWTYEYDYTVLVSDFPSLTNEVRVLFKPEGFPNELRDTSRVGLAVELPVEEGRMTGGGSVFLQSGDTGGPVGTRVTHGFQIHCSPLATNNRLEINWGKPNNHFHLGNLIPASIVCRDTGIVQAPPDAPIDTFEADGVGRFSGTVGDIKYHNVYAEIHFLFTDGGPEKGEPGLYDTAQYRIMIDTDGDGAVDTLALDNFGGDPTADRLDRGNHQAHDEIKRFTSAITQFLSQIEQKLDQLDNPNLSSSQVRRYTDDLLDLFAQFDAEVATTTIATTTATTTSTSSTSTSLGDIWFPPDDDDLVLNGVLVG